jgi:hypothetical protein
MIVMDDKAENAKQQRNMTSMTKGEKQQLKERDQETNLVSINSQKMKRNQMIA